jgi:hypothetical protein
MQLNLEFIEEKERSGAALLPQWEKLEEAARLAAAARLARLIARMLADADREREADDD